MAQLRLDVPVAEAGVSVFRVAAEEQRSNSRTRPSRSALPPLNREVCRRAARREFLLRNNPLEESLGAEQRNGQTLCSAAGGVETSAPPVSPRRARRIQRERIGHYQFRIRGPLNARTHRTRRTHIRTLTHTHTHTDHEWSERERWRERERARVLAHTVYEEWIRERKSTTLVPKKS